MAFSVIARAVMEKLLVEWGSIKAGMGVLLLGDWKECLLITQDRLVLTTAKAWPNKSMLVATMAAVMASGYVLSGARVQNAL